MNCIYEGKFDKFTLDARRKLKEMFILIKYGNKDDYAHFEFKREDVNIVFNQLSGLHLDQETCVYCEVGVMNNRMYVEFVKK